MDEEEEIKLVLSQLPEADTRQNGPGEQSRLTKKDTVSILNQTIPEYLTLLNKDDKPEFEVKLCKMLYEMIWEKTHHGQGIDDFMYRMAICCGFEKMREEYLISIRLKVDSHHVSGGSKLSEMVSELKRIEKH